MMNWWHRNKLDWDLIGFVACLALLGVLLVLVLGIPFRVVVHRF